MDKVLILGINGFTGRHFTEFFEKNRLFDQYAFIGADIDACSNRNIECFKCDLSEQRSICDLLNKTKPDYIVNLAGILRSDQFSLVYKINAELTLNLLTYLSSEKSKVKKVLLIGSAAEYGMPDTLPILETASLKPVNNYGLSKAIQSDYAGYFMRTSKININIARTFNVIGTGVSPLLSLGSFIQQIKHANEGDTLYMGNMNSKRDFIDIEDAVRGYWEILIKAPAGEIFNICSGRSYSVSEIFEQLVIKSRKRLFLSKKNELLQNNDIPDIYGDNTKARVMIGWEPRIGISESLDRMISDGNINS